MPRTNLSDEQFIQLWKENPSIVKMGRATGSSASAAAARRRRIEKQYGIRLATVDDQGRKAYDETMLITEDRVEVKLNVKNGCVLVGGDAHYWPGNIPVMHKAFVYFAKRLKPVASILNGDAFDGASISRHPSIGWEGKPNVKQELDACKNRMWELKKATTGRTIWNAGNHCLRFETRLAAVASEYKDVDGIHLKDHFPEWTPAWFTTINEGQPSHTEIRHRDKGGVHASYNNTKESGVNIVTGHDHRADVVPFNDRRGRRYGVRHGMMAGSCRDPQFVNYLEGRTTNWQSGLALLTYRDGRLLPPELILGVDESHVDFRGETINVAKEFKECDLF